MDRIGRWTVGIYMSVCMLIHNSYLCYRMSVCNVVDIISFLSTDLDDVYHARQYAGTEHSFQE